MFPIHYSAKNGECRYCEKVANRYLKNIINGKFIAICEKCYNERLLELITRFDDSSEGELAVVEVMSEMDE